MKYKYIKKTWFLTLNYGTINSAFWRWRTTKT